MRICVQGINQPSMQHQQQVAGPSASFQQQFPQGWQSQAQVQQPSPLLSMPPSHVPLIPLMRTIVMPPPAKSAPPYSWGCYGQSHAQIPNRPASTPLDSIPTSQVIKCNTDKILKIENAFCHLIFPKF